MIPQSAFNVWENGTENLKVVARISSTKVVQEDRFLSQTRHLKTKLMKSFSTIAKRDYLIWCTKWMWHMVLFRVSLQKNWNIEKYTLTGYHIAGLAFDALRMSRISKNPGKLNILRNCEKLGFFLGVGGTFDHFLGKGDVLPQKLILYTEYILLFSG